MLLCNSLDFLNYWYNPLFSSSFYSSFMELMSVFYAVSNCKKNCKNDFLFSYLFGLLPNILCFIYKGISLSAIFSTTLYLYVFFNFFQKLFFPVLAKTLFILCLKSQILKSEPCFHYSMFSVHVLQYLIMQP